MIQSIDKYCLCLATDIDKQNCGPFYGFAVGDFEEGTGNVFVECSARVIAAVNTKNRMAKVDGRFPHWVGPYDSKTDRYSLIYYRTDGEVEQIGPAVFDVPTACVQLMKEETLPKSDKK